MKKLKLIALIHSWFQAHILRQHDLLNSRYHAQWNRSLHFRGSVFITRLAVRIRVVPLWDMFLNLLLYCPCLCSHCCKVCDLFESKRICADCFIMCWNWRFIYEEGRVSVPLTSLTPPHLCTCSKLGPVFPTSYVVVFCVFSELKWERWFLILLIFM